jgi:hypothetical protein
MLARLICKYNHLVKCRRSISLIRSELIVSLQKQEDFIDGDQWQKIKLLNKISEKLFEIDDRIGKLRRSIAFVV